MAKRSTSQKILEGAILEFHISENRKTFGRIISSEIALYNFWLVQNDSLPDLSDIINKDIFQYCSIYNNVIKKGLFPIIGVIPLTQQDIDKVPPKFHQDIGNGNCKIWWHDGTEREALPEECIGLEPSMVWGYKELIERIEDFFAGKKNYNVEYSKVILYESDPRFQAGREGRKLIWDSKKRGFSLLEE